MSAPSSPFRFMTLMLLSGTALMLTACGTTPAKGPNTSKIVEQPSANQGGESLASAEKAYKKNSDDAGAAIRYSRALREAGRYSRASIIMTPFAKDDRKPSAAAKSEFAAVQVALGNYDVAADSARKSIAMNDKSWQAHHILGIALDAKGDNANAEKSLRKALELAPPEQQTAILNNLGLNLAAQGFLDEAAETLRKALATAPDRGEVERNLRIVSALRQSGGRAPSYMQTYRDAQMKKDAEATAAAEKKAAAKAAAAKAKADSSGDEEAIVAPLKSTDKATKTEDAPAPAKKPQYN
ncbi:MAG: hypothetical protein JWO78_249 [Micavibrio sp.]|nr:hypothetical protein [Micavibrio sp.]